MFILRLINFFTGYVTLLVQSDAPEKLINLAAGRGILLWDVQMPAEGRVFLKIRLSAVKPFKHIARKTGSRFEIYERRGLPFLLARLKRRKALVAGGAFFLLAIYFLSSFVWFVEVSGNQRIAEYDIIKAAEAAGLERGTPRWKLNVGAVEKRIQEQLPVLSWVGVYIRGTKADIKVVEKTLAEEKEAGFSHVVAVKAGLVEDVLVLKGHPAVKKGDTVAPGQVLISGIVPPPEAAAAEQEGAEKEAKPAPPEPAYVDARGIVRARVWYEEYGEAPLVEKGKRYTGRVVTKLWIKIGEKEIILKGPPEVPFALYQQESFTKKLPEWRNLRPGVELITLKYRELQDYTITRSRAQAVQLAKEKALAGMKQKLPKNAIILRERVEELVVNQPENVARVRAYLETLEDIGVNKPFSVK
ncbi:MAG: sporulation protein YqfD [Armatimonadetes bacterium]|nr:sporulation protein YqfD [Armatimonadota bacterium]